MYIAIETFDLLNMFILKPSCYFIFIIFMFITLYPWIKVCVVFILLGRAWCSLCTVLVFLVQLQVKVEGNVLFCLPLIVGLSGDHTSVTGLDANRIRIYCYKY